MWFWRVVYEFFAEMGPRGCLLYFTWCFVLAIPLTYILKRVYGF